MSFKTAVKKPFIFFLFTLIVWGVPGDGFSCSTIVNEKPAVNRSNVRNQDGLGWCYSYVAADLLSYKTGKRISALGLVRPGVYFDIAIPKQRVAGYTAQKTLEYIEAKKNLCLESEISSTDYELSRKNKIASNLYLHNILSDIQSIYHEGREVIDKNYMAREKKEPEQCLSSGSMEKLKKIFPGLTCKAVLEIVSAYTKEGFLDNLIKKSCQTMKMPEFVAETKHKREFLVFENDIVRDVDQALESKNIAGIGYNYARVTNMKGEANHASIIVGRKLNPKTKQCEYLVRNSHGKNCSARNPETRCDTSCANDFSKDCKRENGYFWVSKRLLSEIMYSVTVVK